MFFDLSELLFSADFLQFKGNFILGQNNSKYHDSAPIKIVQGGGRGGGGEVSIGDVFK